MKKTIIILSIYIILNLILAISNIDFFFFSLIILGGSLLLFLPIISHWKKIKPKVFFSYSLSIQSFIILTALIFLLYSSTKYYALFTIEKILPGKSKIESFNMNYLRYNDSVSCELIQMAFDYSLYEEGKKIDDVKIIGLQRPESLQMDSINDFTVLSRVLELGQFEIVKSNFRILGCDSIIDINSKMFIGDEAKKEYREFWDDLYEHIKDIKGILKEIE